MDVSVANLSTGQRKIAETKEKAKNNVGLIATGAAGVSATIGTARFVEKAVEAKDKIYKDTFCISKTIKGGNPVEEIKSPITKADKFFAKIGKYFETFYDKAEVKYHNSNLGKTIEDMTKNFKELSRDKRGAILILGAVGLGSVVATAVKGITTYFKNKQIEQKYN